MLAFFALELDTERLFQRNLDAMKSGKIVIFGPGARLAGLGSE